MTDPRPRERPVPRVESFSPELMAVLMRGATSGLSIPMPYHKAVKFRQRLYMLRKAMRMEKHPLYPVVSRVRASITWPDTTPVTISAKQVPYPTSRKTPVTVEIAPLDSEYTELLRAAGVQIETQTAPDSEGAVPKSTLDDYLADLKKGT